MLNDILEFRSVCWDTLQNAINVTHWKVVAIGGTGEPTMAEKQAAIDGVWAPLIKTVISNVVTYRGNKMRTVFPVPTADVARTSQAGVGSLVGNALPNQVAPLISLRAATAPPKTRGRLYLPAPTVAQLTAAGSWTGAFTTLMTAIGNAMTANIAVAGAGGTACTLTPVLYHRKPPQASYPITSAINRGYGGTQRRRNDLNRGDAPAV